MSIDFLWACAFWWSVAWWGVFGLVFVGALRSGAFFRKPGLALSLLACTAFAPWVGPIVAVMAFKAATRPPNSDSVDDGR